MIQYESSQDMVKASEQLFNLFLYDNEDSLPQVKAWEKTAKNGDDLIMYIDNQDQEFYDRGSLPLCVTKKSNPDEL